MNWIRFLKGFNPPTLRSGATSRSRINHLGPAVKPRDDRCKDKSYNVKDRALILNIVIPRSLPSLNRSILRQGYGWQAPGMTKKTAGPRLLVSQRLVLRSFSEGGRRKRTHLITCLKNIFFIVV
jgi:hypothetical protein